MESTDGACLHVASWVGRDLYKGTRAPASASVPGESRSDPVLNLTPVILSLAHFALRPLALEPIASEFVSQ